MGGRLPLPPDRPRATQWVPTMPWPARRRTEFEAPARTRLGRWLERRRLRRALQLQFRADSHLPMMSGWSAVIGRLLVICPGVADVRILSAERGRLTVRVRLAWWTWISFGLLHYFVGRTLVRHRHLWCPPGWTITVVIA